MARRRKPDNDNDHDNHDRWLVSYADFITLLFAFFVVMYAISQVNEGKYRVLSNSLMQAFKPDPTSSTILLPQHGPGSPGAAIRRMQVDRAAEEQRRAREQRMRAIAQQVMQALA